MTSYKNPQKLNYIKMDGNNNLVLVVNRGYGKGQYHFNYALIDHPDPYIVENHLMCIYYRGELDRTQLLEKYGFIIQSFNKPLTQQFIKLYFSNNAINAVELQNILPIYY